MTANKKTEKFIEMMCMMRTITNQGLDLTLVQEEENPLSLYGKDAKILAKDYFK